MSSHEFETSTSGGGGEFNPIDELDPSLCNGFRVIYDREVRNSVPLLIPR
jgi:hypothetical protein